MNFNLSSKFPRQSVATMERGDKFQTITLHRLLLAICALLLIYKYCCIQIIGTPITHPEFSLLGPYNTTEILVEDTYDQLIDITDFSFIVNPPVCKDYPAGLLMIVIVTSNPVNFDKRKVIRSTWGRNTDTMKLVFMIGETANSAIAKQISNEIEEYGDIVQGTFTDAYRNMTYKHVMGLKWVAHHCPKAKYVLKTDDDVLVYSRELRQFLVKALSPWGARDLIACQIIEKAAVQRGNTLKWSVSKGEYASNYYPTYCAGWTVLYSIDVVSRLLKAAQSSPYFWIDDVHVTGILAEKIGVARTPFNKFVLNEWKEKIFKMIDWSYVAHHMFGPPDLSTDRIIKLWKSIPE